MNKQDTFPSDIRTVSRRDAGMLKKIVINLAIAATDLEYGIAGNMFYVFDAPSGTYIDIKVNETRENPISFVEQTGLRTPFDKLYITTPAGQAGNLTLVYGTEAPDLVDVIDNRSALTANVDAIRDELRGDTAPEGGGEVTVGAAAVQALAANADRKGCIIQADFSNTGLVYLWFDNTATTAAGGNKWFGVLAAGMAFTVDDYRGDIYAIATAANQLIGTGEW